MQRSEDASSSAPIRRPASSSSKEIAPVVRSGPGPHRFIMTEGEEKALAEVYKKLEDIAAQEEKSRVRAAQQSTSEKKGGNEEPWCMDTLADLLGIPRPSDEIKAGQVIDAEKALMLRRLQLDHQSINARLEKARQKSAAIRSKHQAVIRQMASLDYQMRTMEGEAEMDYVNADLPPNHPFLLAKSSSHMVVQTVDQFQKLLQEYGLLTHKAYIRCRNTVFMRYLSQKTSVFDVNVPEREVLDLVMSSSLKLPDLRVMRVTDGDVARRQRLLLNSGKRSISAEKASPKPDDQEIVSKLSSFLPRAMAFHAMSLRHVELVGLQLLSWRSITESLQEAINLRVLYIRRCNITKAELALFVSALSSISVNHVAFSECGLTKDCAYPLTRLLACQAQRREEFKWRAGLRSQDNDRKVAHSLLQQGLMSLDVSNNLLGDEGVAELVSAVARDQWLLSLDVRGNGADALSVDAIVRTLQDNTNIISIKLDDVVAPSPPTRSDTHQLASHTDAIIASLDPFYPLRLTRLMSLYTMPAHAGTITSDYGQMRDAFRKCRRALRQRSYWSQLSSSSSSSPPSSSSTGAGAGGESGLVDSSGIREAPMYGPSGGGLLMPALDLMCDDKSMLEPIMHLKNSGRLRRRGRVAHPTYTQSPSSSSSSFSSSSTSTSLVSRSGSPTPPSSSSSSQTGSLSTADLLDEVQFLPTYMEAIDICRSSLPPPPRSAALEAMRQRLATRLERWRSYMGASDAVASLDDLLRRAEAAGFIAETEAGGAGGNIKGAAHASQMPHAARRSVSSVSSAPSSMKGSSTHSGAIVNGYEYDDDVDGDDEDDDEDEANANEFLDAYTAWEERVEEEEAAAEDAYYDRLINELEKAVVDSTGKPLPPLLSKKEQTRVPMLTIPPTGASPSATTTTSSSSSPSLSTSSSTSSTSTSATTPSSVNSRSSTPRPPTSAPPTTTTAPTATTTAAAAAASASFSVRGHSSSIPSSSSSSTSSSIHRASSVRNPSTTDTQDITHSSSASSARPAASPSSSSSPSSENDALSFPSAADIDPALWAARDAARLAARRAAADAIKAAWSTNADLDIDDVHDTYPYSPSSSSSNIGSGSSTKGIRSPSGDTRSNNNDTEDGDGDNVDDENSSFASRVYHPPLGVTSSSSSRDIFDDSTRMYPLTPAGILALAKNITGSSRATKTSSSSSSSSSNKTTTTTTPPDVRRQRRRDNARAAVMSIAQSAQSAQSAAALSAVSAGTARPGPVGNVSARLLSRQQQQQQAKPWQRTSTGRMSSSSSSPSSSSSSSSPSSLSSSSSSSSSTVPVMTVEDAMSAVPSPAVLSAMVRELAEKQRAIALNQVAIEQAMQQSREGGQLAMKEGNDGKARRPSSSSKTGGVRPSSSSSSSSSPAYSSTMGVRSPSSSQKGSSGFAPRYHQPPGTGYGPSASSSSSTSSSGVGAGAGAGGRQSHTGKAFDPNDPVTNALLTKIKDMAREAERLRFANDRLAKHVQQQQAQQQHYYHQTSYDSEVYGATSGNN